MNEQLNQLEDMARAGLARKRFPTPMEIRDLIAGLRQIFTEASVTDEAAEDLAQRLEAEIVIEVPGPIEFPGDDYAPWLGSAKERIDPYYWDRYRRDLIQQRLPQTVVANLDQVTDTILDLMQDPTKDGHWDRRGMVIGHVQSGKTANYIGLMCKAADAGCKVIVIIAGVHNNLRSQTQRRVDEGFVGRNSVPKNGTQDDTLIGVGRFDGTRKPSPFTNTVRDFNTAVADQVGIPLRNLKEPAVFVIKKNSTTLKVLIDWLRQHSASRGGSAIDEPMLLIDDEADNASINVRHGVGEVTRINSQIRELLRIFNRSCYVGYTATPFANIFIEPDTDHAMLGADLFPKSFIVSLDPPSNYFGASSVFLENPEKHIRDIDDNEDCLPLRHPQHFEIEAIPPSLEDAVRTFILCRAIRLLRGHDGQHCSMLVNASRFVNVQAQLRLRIHDRLDGIKRSIRVNGALPVDEALNDPEIRALREIWEREFASSGCGWAQIQESLHRAVSPIVVVEVNSKSPGSLNYAANQQGGLNVIAVGGYSLSRGLTLEGLMVSYFLRNSMMYDTLMQMGRWFGYRPEYEDLCRIWMPEEAQGWYEHIAESIEELREDLRRMEAGHATPANFGLRVRSHPDSLIITAKNKMGSSSPVVVDIGLAGKLVETHVLHRDEASLNANRNAARKLAERLCEAEYSVHPAKSIDTGHLFRNVPVEIVLSFLTEFQDHEGSLLTYGEPKMRYIEERAGDELEKWDVLFASLKDASEKTVDLLNMTINCQQRTAGKTRDARTLRIGTRQRVSGRGIEKSGLTTNERKLAEQTYRAESKKTGSPADNPALPDWVYRKHRKRPLLMVHLLDIKDDEVPPPELPVVAWGISFPETKREQRFVRYSVNTTWMRENFGEDADDDDMEGDVH